MMIFQMNIGMSIGGRTMNIDKYLEEVAKINAKIQNKKYEYDMWVGIAESTTCGYGERVQTSSDGQRTPNAVTRYLDIEKEIKSLEAEQKRFIGYIEQLPVKYYNLLHRIYIRNLTPKQVQLATGCHYSTITSTHNRAKKALKKLIEGEKNV